jgi:hypothetical protein
MEIPSLIKSWELPLMLLAIAKAGKTQKNKKWAIQDYYLQFW